MTRARRIAMLLALVLSCATPARASYLQQGAELTASPDGVISPQLGYSVALSADGNTALLGAPGDNSYTGAAWVFTRSGSTWTEQAKLTGGGQLCGGCADYFGSSVALSADGNTALIGGWGDAGDIGAAWVFTRSGSAWTQQGPKLTGSREVGEGRFGSSVSLSADGNTALVGAPDDYGYAGAAWIFTRWSSTWTQEGPKLVASDESERQESWLGTSVALSADGDIALIGGPNDDDHKGAAWVFARSQSIWSQAGNKLEGGGEVGQGGFGRSVALSADETTALIGAAGDSQGVGAAWVFGRSGSGWLQEGEKLTGSGLGSYPPYGFGWRLALSANGKRALIAASGGDRQAAWLFTRSGSSWTQLSEGLVGGEASVALSADGDTALVGNGSDGAFVFVVAPALSAPTQLSFGSQPVGQQGAVRWVQVSDTGLAPLAPLTFTGPAHISGPDAANFTIPSGDDLCDGQTLQPEEDCLIGVRFNASAVGWRSATLSWGPNNGAATVPDLALRGTGVEPPTASFTATPDPAAARGAVGFDASASSAPDGSITRYMWSFGDGTSAEGASASHVYAAPGIYSITLTVTDNDGLSAMATRSLTVEELAIAPAAQLLTSTGAHLTRHAALRNRHRRHTRRRPLRNRRRRARSR